LAFVEVRIWPEGSVCPHCGGVERISKMQGKSTRHILYKCCQCCKPLTVRMGTIFESSHVPLQIWLQAMYLTAASKKGISFNQFHRTLGVILKTAWFMSHRIREAMRNGELLPVGDDGGRVEVGLNLHRQEAPYRASEKPLARSTKLRVVALVDPTRLMRANSGEWNEV
jgi:transposase-like protein